MTAQNRDRGGTGRIQQVATVAVAGGIAAATSILLSAASTTVKLVGVSAQGNAVLIEATEPVAYSVDRPDPLTLVVDMRNVSVGDARSDVPRQGALAGVRLEQASGIDGRAIARVHVSLVRPAEYRVRSARNTIRVELSPAGTGTAASPVAAPAAVSKPPHAKPVLVREPGVPRSAPASVPKRASTSAHVPPATADGVAPATVLERVHTSRSANGTTITLTGDGLLTPARMTESEDAPRRLLLDFPNVGSTAPAQTDVNSALVKKVRVGLNSHEPLVTRVVMEIDPSATYHVERAGEGGRDLAVVFGRTQAPTTVMLAPPELPVAGGEPEPPISMEQAIANAAAITPPTQEVVMASGSTPAPARPAGRSADAAKPVPDPMSALNLVAPPLERNAEPVERPRPAPASAPAARSVTSQAPVAPPAAPQPTAPMPPMQEAPRPQMQSTQPPAAPSQPAPQSQGPPVPGQAEKKYTGHPISMDFQGVDLRAVLRAFAEPSGLNFIIDPDVQGSVDMVLTDVPWDQALEVILRANQLDYTVDGTIVRIARMETLKRENDSRQALAKSVADAGTLEVRTFSLSYASALKTAPLIKRAALSPRGDVQIDERTNTLIVTDLPAKLDMAANLISTIDRAEPQVEIEARIITTTREFARAIGVQWGLNGRMSPQLGNTTSLGFPNQGSLGGRLGSQGPGGTDVRAGELDRAGTVVNLPAPAANSAIGLALGAVNGAFNLDIALSALERTGKGRILSTPRVTTQNNVEAEITQGVQIPVQTVANNTVTVTFKDAALTLKVTPQITAANTVIMQITLENATPGTPVQGIPSIDTQRAITRVQVSDGMTTVMGGIFVSREQSTTDRTPVLHRVPLLGWLFKRDDDRDESRELLIFITPRILKG